MTSPTPAARRGSAQRPPAAAAAARKDVDVEPPVYTRVQSMAHSNDTRDFNRQRKSSGGRSGDREMGPDRLQCKW